jgi:hypothetical protein
MPNKWLTSVTGNLLAGSSEMLCKLEWWNFSPTRLVEEQTRANQLYEKRRSQPLRQFHARARESRIRFSRR